MTALKRKLITERTAKGFTLIEVTLSLVIVGLGIAALMVLLGSGTQVNKYGNDLATSVFLAQELRSMTDEVTFIDLLSYNGSTYNGVDAGGSELAGMGNYQQQLQVWAVNPEDLTLYVGDEVEAVVITAKVLHDGEEVTRISWIRTE